METSQKPKTVFSRFVRTGKKSYFFDVNEGSDGHRWLSVCESRRLDDGKYARSRLFVSPDAAIQFVSCLQETVGHLGGAGRTGGETDEDRDD